MVDRAPDLIRRAAAKLRQPAAKSTMEPLAAGVEGPREIRSLPSIDTVQLSDIGLRRPSWAPAEPQQRLVNISPTSLAQQ